VLFIAADHAVNMPCSFRTRNISTNKMKIDKNNERGMRQKGSIFNQ
jgi:hypothetical protein